MPDVPGVWINAVSQVWEADAWPQLSSDDRVLGHADSKSAIRFDVDLHVRPFFTILGSILSGHFDEISHFLQILP